MMVFIATQFRAWAEGSELKVRKKNFLASLQEVGHFDETLPEAQRTQGIASLT